MANTYTQLYLQIVFSTKYRKPLIKNEWKEELFQYISGIITAKRHKSLIVNGHRDHIHAFVGLNPAQSVSDLTRDIKAIQPDSSTKEISVRLISDGRKDMVHFHIQEEILTMSTTIY